MPNLFEENPTAPRELVEGKLSPDHAVFYCEKTNEYVSFNEMQRRGYFIVGYDFSEEGIGDVTVTWEKLPEVQTN